ncbi:MAG: hypothetical protein C4584_01530 [Armatimonadetes bacterium]|nr:MAG: hypothetical protein C4584_01530 [Armatimonadota bacterium]
MIPVSLLYHININHLSLSFGGRAEYLENILGEILDSIKVNSNISVCGEDLLILSLWNKSVFDRLVNHPKLKFMLSTYSHALPNHFPETYLINVKLGNLIIRNLVPKEKIINIGYSPEVDLPSMDILKGITKYWSALVLGETRIRIQGMNQESYPPLFSICTDLGKNSLYGVLSRRHFNFREYYHKYLRCQLSANKLCEGIIKDFYRFSQPYPILLRIDLETLLFNRCIGNNGHRGKVPLKRFIKYQECLLKRDFNFQWLDVSRVASGGGSIRKFLSEEVMPSKEEDYKWENSELRTKVSKLLKKRMTLNHYIQVLSLECSDYYCSNFDDIGFTVRNDREIVILKRRVFRDQESNIKLKLLRTNKLEQVLSRIPDKNLARYLRYYFDSVSYIADFALKKLKTESSREADKIFIVQESDSFSVRPLII